MMEFPHPQDPAGRARSHMHFDHVPNSHHQNGAPVQAVSRGNGFEDSEARDERINTEISTLCQRCQTPLSRYPPFHRGNGTYTHVLRPSAGLATLGQQKNDLARTLQVLSLPPSVCSDRSSKKRAPDLPDNVAAAFDALRKVLAEKEKLRSDTMSPFDRFQALRPPDQGAVLSDRRDSDDTTMSGMSGDGRNGRTSRASSRTNNVTAPLSLRIPSQRAILTQDGNAQPAWTPTYITNFPERDAGGPPPPSEGRPGLANTRTATSGQTVASGQSVPTGSNIPAQRSKNAYDATRDPRRRGR